MRIKESALYLFLLLLFLLVDAVIFYLLWGLSVLLYAGVFVFAAGILILVYFFARTGPAASGRQDPSPVQAPLCEKEALMNDIRNMPAEETAPGHFTLHKRIIFIELSVIILLVILLFIRKSM